MVIQELGDINESRKVVSDLKLRGGSSSHTLNIDMSVNAES